MKSFTQYLNENKSDAELLTRHNETYNHLGEREFNSWHGWLRALRAKYPNVQIEGDKDIAHATADGKTIGEWDGVVGVLYKEKL